MFLLTFMFVIFVALTIISIYSANIVLTNISWDLHYESKHLQTLNYVYVENVRDNIYDDQLR